MSTVLSLLISIVVVMAAVGIGRAARRLWLSGDESVFERLLLDAAVGLGALSLCVFAYLAFHLPAHVSVVVFMILAAAVGAVSVIQEVVGCGRPSMCKTRVCAGVPVLALAIIALIPALAPPSASDWDSLAYHLAVPKLYLQHGGLYYIDFTSHSNFPMLMEMLYVPGLALNNPVAAKLMHYWVGLMLICSVVVLARRLNGSGAMAAVVVAGMPIVLWEATTAYVDLATALYTVLCVYLFVRLLDKPDNKLLVGCAMCAGFAASTKMTALALIPLMVLWFLIDRYAAERKLRWKPALWFSLIALLVCCPWYIKSFVYTGNPVYPFFYSIFGGRDWTAALASNYSTLQAKFGVGHGIGAFLLLPWPLLSQLVNRQESQKLT